MFAALKILDDGLVPSGQLIGSWGGAVGMTQMIPTTFIESAYDWDGGGIDIWNSYADAFASTANYLTSIDRIHGQRTALGAEKFCHQKILNLFMHL